MGDIASAVSSQLQVGTALASIGKYAPIIGTFIALSLGIYFVSHVLKKGSHGRGGI
jgi:hypothetical protein